jgi:hypothetical protein
MTTQTTHHQKKLSQSGVTAPKIKVLHLTLKRKWFDLIRSGTKTEEYREIKQFWNKRLFAHKFTHVCFRNGYKRNAPTHWVELGAIEVGVGQTEWGAQEGVEVYILKLRPIPGVVTYPHGQYLADPERPRPHKFSYDLVNWEKPRHRCDSLLVEVGGGQNEGAKQLPFLCSVGESEFRQRYRFANIILETLL